MLREFKVWQKERREITKITPTTTRTIKIKITITPPPPTTTTNSNPSSYPHCTITNSLSLQTKNSPPSPPLTTITPPHHHHTSQSGLRSFDIRASDDAATALFKELDSQKYVHQGEECEDEREESVRRTSVRMSGRRMSGRLSVRMRG